MPHNACHIAHLNLGGIPTQSAIQYMIYINSHTCAQYSIFYAVSQAVFLIFCFRWRDLLEDHEDVDEFASAGALAKKWMPELDVLHRAVNSDLNPLKVCRVSHEISQRTYGCHLL